VCTSSGSIVIRSPGACVDSLPRDRQLAAPLSIAPIA
jgi:hypothetical protein